MLNSFEQKFITAAYTEGLLCLKGDQNKAGSSIEKYLSVFRAVLAQKDSKYLSLKYGYDWCCAYVYYLLNITNYRLEINPLPNFNQTLACVITWYDWANYKNIFIDSKNQPVPGDLVIFDKLIENVELDHIGIVIANNIDSIVTSEGNYLNASGIFRRKKDSTIRGYIRLSNVSHEYWVISK